MAGLMVRLQRAILTGASENHVRGLLAELAIPAGGPWLVGGLRGIRHGILRPDDELDDLRAAFAKLGLTGNGTGTRPLPRIRSAILGNLIDSEATLRQALDDLLTPGDLGEGGGGETGGTAPTDITWAGSHTVQENVALNTVVGGALSATDPEDTVTFSLVDNAGGLFALGDDGRWIVVTGVIDYETATSHNITVRATDGIGLTYDEVFAVTVTDVDENPPPIDPDEDGEIIVDDPEVFVVPPTVVAVDDAIAFQGNKKKGSSGKFVFDIGPAKAGETYTVQYDPDWSLLENSGRSAMVGFGLRRDNDFRLSGLKGDAGAGLKAYEVFGTNKWDKTTGFQTSDGGVAAHGSQSGPNWIQFAVAADGVKYTTRTSADGLTWVDEFTATTPAPFTNVTGVTTFGIAVFLDINDAGPFRIDITLWHDTSVVNRTALYLSQGIYSMAVDYSVLLYDPVYAEIGVLAEFAAGEIEATLTVIDDTRPKTLPAGSGEVRSVGPGAFARIPELVENGIARDDWQDAVLSFNGRSWVVRSYELRGSPNGEDQGEVRFLLKALENSA